MKILLPANQVYKLIIKRRRKYRYFILLSLICLMILGAIFEENVVLITFGIFCIITAGWSWFLYFTMCPKCYGNFFGKKYTSKGTAIFFNRYFFNNKCNNCGYGGE